MIDENSRKFENSILGSTTNTITTTTTNNNNNSNNNNNIRTKDDDEDDDEDGEEDDEDDDEDDDEVDEEPQEAEEPQEDEEQQEDEEPQEDEAEDPNQFAPPRLVKDQQRLQHKMNALLELSIPNLPQDPNQEQEAVFLEARRAVEEWYHPENANATRVSDIVDLRQLMLTIPPTKSMPTACYKSGQWRNCYVLFISHKLESYCSWMAEEERQNIAWKLSFLSPCAQPLVSGSNRAMRLFRSNYQMIVAQGQTSLRRGGFLPGQHVDATPQQRELGNILLDGLTCSHSIVALNPGTHPLLDLVYWHEHSGTLRINNTALNALRECCAQNERSMEQIVGMFLMAPALLVASATSSNYERTLLPRLQELNSPTGLSMKRFLWSIRTPGPIALAYSLLIHEYWRLRKVHENEQGANQDGQNGNGNNNSNNNGPQTTKPPRTYSITRMVCDKVEQWWIPLTGRRWVLDFNELRLGALQQFRAGKMDITARDADLLSASGNYRESTQQQGSLVRTGMNEMDTDEF